MVCEYWRDESWTAKKHNRIEEIAENHFGSAEANLDWWKAIWEFSKPIWTAKILCTYHEIF